MALLTYRVIINLHTYIYTKCTGVAAVKVKVCTLYSSVFMWNNNNNNNNNNQDNVYGAVIVLRALREFTRFTRWMQLEAPRGRRPLDQADRLEPIMRFDNRPRQLGNYIHHRHLLSLLSSKADAHFTVPQRVEGWVDLGVWLHTVMIYLPAVTHPSINRARRRVTCWSRPPRYC